MKTSRREFVKLAGAIGAGLLGAGDLKAEAMPWDGTRPWLRMSTKQWYTDPYCTGLRNGQLYGKFDIPCKFGVHK